MFIEADESTAVIFPFICCFILNVALPKIIDPSQLQSMRYCWSINRMSNVEVEFLE